MVQGEIQHISQKINLSRISISTWILDNWRLILDTKPRSCKSPPNLSDNGVIVVDFLRDGGGSLAGQGRLELVEGEGEVVTLLEELSPLADICL